MRVYMVVIGMLVICAVCVTVSESGPLVSALHPDSSIQLSEAGIIGQLRSKRDLGVVLGKAVQVLVETVHGLKNGIHKVLFNRINARNEDEHGSGYGPKD